MAGRSSHRAQPGAGEFSGPPPPAESGSPHSGFSCPCVEASLFKMFRVAAGVLPEPDRRSNRELGRRREAPTHRCQCRRVPGATRSASLSSTSHRFAARPDPTRVSGPRAPDRERAARAGRPSPPGPDPTPRGPDRGWSLPANDGSRIGNAGIGRASSSPIAGEPGGSTYAASIGPTRMTGASRNRAGPHQHPRTP